MALSKKEKLKKLQEISKKEAATAKWKQEAKWNRDHADALADYMIIATRILLCLKDKGMSQRELAKQLDVSPQALTRIVKGRQNLTLQTIRKIEGVLGIELISITKPNEVKIRERVRFVSVNVDYSSQINVFKGVLTTVDSTGNKNEAKIVDLKLAS